MKKGLKVFLICVLVVVVIVGIALVCCQFRYLKYKNEYMKFKESVIGKTSAQVQEMYGEFDHYSMHPCEDGLFRYTECSYTVIEAKVGYLGTTPPWVISIGFDGNGVAVRVTYEQADYYF